VDPTWEARLREAKFDLAARYRVDTDEKALLDQFFREAFEGWLRTKMPEAQGAATAPAAVTARPARGGNTPPPPRRRRG
jgi:hypothetical protein